MITLTLRFVLLFVFFCGHFLWPRTIRGQSPDFNLTEVGDLAFQEGCNDVWGFVDANGVEYAIVGTRAATVVVSLENPSVPEEIYRVPGSTTTWRDMKTWGNYIYSVCDDCPEGLLIMDMSDIDDIGFKFIDLIVDVENALDYDIGSSHNIWIDELGYLYLVGGESINGGLIVLDLNDDPLDPTFVGVGPNIYAHDVFVRDQIAYASNIYEGNFAIYDLTDPTEIVYAGAHATTTAFTHNAWLSDNSEYLFTTDERDFAYVESYDVRDFQDINRVDRYRPTSTAGTGATPHNVHVLNDYLVISYYTEGVKIVDAQYPDNLVEVGSFDTWDGPSGGTNGNWGAYPFLPSGLVLISDRTTGLHVLRPNYQRASYLHGQVFDAETGNAIPNASIEILGDFPNTETTSNFGTYKTGIAQSGVFNVKFSARGYRDTILSVALGIDSISILDASLTSTLAYTEISGRIVSSNGLPLPDKVVYLENIFFNQTFITDDEGVFTGLVKEIFPLQLSVGSWGYGDTLLTVRPFELNDFEIQLPGSGDYFSDRFLVDQGWITDDAFVGGVWERGAPQGTGNPNELVNPSRDSPNDLGDPCYVTGLMGLTANDNDVDGKNILYSPSIILDGQEESVLLSFDYWFHSYSGNFVSDTFEVYALFNGEIVGEIISQYSAAVGVGVQIEWESVGPFDILPLLSDFSGSGQLQIVFHVGDSFNSVFHVSEAGVDNFLVEVNRVSARSNVNVESDINIYPNPFENELFIDVSNSSYQFKQVLVHSIQGQLMSDVILEDEKLVDLNFDLPVGIYMVTIVAADGNRFVRRVVKSR